MRITKLLSLDSAPAQAIVDRAKAISLTMAQRVTPPESFSVGSDMVENGLGQVRPLEVGDILVDEKGGFYKIEAAAEDIYKVTGDIALMQEAVYAFTARGLRVAQTDDGFAVVAIPQFKQLLEILKVWPRAGGVCRQTAFSLFSQAGQEGMPDQRERIVFLLRATGNLRAQGGRQSFIRTVKMENR